MPAGYPEYPGPHDAEEGETYTYQRDGDAVAATVKAISKAEDGSVLVSLQFDGTEKSQS